MTAEGVVAFIASDVGNTEFLRWVNGSSSGRMIGRLRGSLEGWGFLPGFWVSRDL